jgi:hypothetical protein
LTHGAHTPLIHELATCNTLRYAPSQNLQRDVVEVAQGLGQIKISASSRSALASLKISSSEPTKMRVFIHGLADSKVTYLPLVWKGRVRTRDLSRIRHALDWRTGKMDVA